MKDIWQSAFTDRCLSDAFFKIDFPRREMRTPDSVDVTLESNTNIIFSLQFQLNKQVGLKGVERPCFQLFQCLVDNYVHDVRSRVTHSDMPCYSWQSTSTYTQESADALRNRSWKCSNKKVWGQLDPSTQLGYKWLYRPKQWTNKANMSIKIQHNMFYM